MHSKVLIACHLVVWRIAQILTKKDRTFWAGATKTVFLLKTFFTRNKQNEVRTNVKIKHLSWNDTRQRIYDCRFCNLKQLSSLPSHLRSHLPYDDANCKGCDTVFFFFFFFFNVFLLRTIFLEKTWSRIT